MDSYMSCSHTTFTVQVDSPLSPARSRSCVLLPRHRPPKRSLLLSAKPSDILARRPLDRRADLARDNPVRLLGRMEFIEPVVFVSTYLAPIL